LAAGLRGIENSYTLPDESDMSIVDMSEAGLRNLGMTPLPSNLSDAVDVMESSALVKDTLGEHLFEWFIRNKRDEWSAYKSEVTDFELQRYLPRL
jgi:glutamine synthetase